MKKIWFEMIFIVIGLVICNFIFDYDLFNRNIGVWIELVGGIMIFSSILTVFMLSLNDTIVSIALGLALCIGGVTIDLNMYNPNYPNPWEAGTPERQKIDYQTIGQCPNAEWIFVLKYNEFGCVTEINKNFTGTVDQAEKALQNYAVTWDASNPIDKKIQSSYKCLVFVPRQWLKDHKFSLDYSNRDNF